MALVVLCCFTLMSAAATARGVMVLLLRPAHPSAAAGEAIVRLRGELLAAGYTVELADIPERGGVKAAMESPLRPAGADAVVALFGDDPQGPGSLWVIDRGSGKAITRPIPHDAEGERGAQILSVRALELLRASFLEAALAPPTPAAVSPPRNTIAVPAAPQPVARAEAPAPPAGAASEPAPTPAREAPPVPSPPSSVSRGAPPPVVPRPAPTVASVAATATPTRGSPAVMLEAGGLALGSFDGMPPAVLPLLRIALTPAADWPISLRLTAAGLGRRARVSDAQGTAEVSHQLALAEGVWGFRRGHRWQPFVALGAGAVYVSADGVPAVSAQAVSASLGRTAATWAFVADAGAGMRVNLSRRLHLAGELHAQSDAPSPAIRFRGTQLASEGRPTWLACLSVGVGL